jgi:hypothetical protein
MKGVITGINPSANIIDICHNVPPQDIMSGAYLLAASYKYFPRGTIHVAVVDPGVGSGRSIVCVNIRDYLFLVPDNGLLSFVISEEKPKSIFRVTNRKYFLPSPSNTFHGRDIFAPVAAHLSLGIRPQQLGVRNGQLNQLDIPKPGYNKKGQLEGHIIYVDRFGNLITNITREHFDQYSRDLIIPRNLSQSTFRKRGSKGIYREEKEKFLLCKAIETIIGKKKVAGLNKTYTDVQPGEPLVLFGSAGFLEVSVNQGNARKYFKADKGKKIIVKMWSY